MEQPESLRALAFESNGKFVASIGLPCMAQLHRRHAHLSEASLSEDVEPSMTASALLGRDVQKLTHRIKACSLRVAVDS